jgi:hypothetical protein
MRLASDLVSAPRRTMAIGLLKRRQAFPARERNEISTSFEGRISRTLIEPAAIQSDLPERIDSQAHGCCRERPTFLRTY